MISDKLKGGIYVALGASSYGMLTTCVKMAYHEGFNVAEVTVSQYVLGALGLLILNLFRKNKSMILSNRPSAKTALQLVAAGASLGLTSLFYYLAVQYVSVGVGIVLLMQSVWMGVIAEMIVHKKMPGSRTLLAVIIILGGTVLAAAIGQQGIRINWIGIGWGLLAAVSYTATMYSSNRVGLHFPPLKRSLYMILGGLIIILSIFHAHLNQDFSFRIFVRWGIILSLFGTILPPILLTKGMPLTGMGLGAIIASLEIPVSVLMAFVLINEHVSGLQWLGVVLILLAVVLMNVGNRTPIPG
ncbi:Threonine/homoserine efflux transporter RhtA [Mucilaginibacter lappiensis]|uniref:Drug/metabolite transporter (DMT)-like permease n=1 Tax=Mucilaginibacter lappiensis TaxID=354630 RepID=A0ABR6PDE2_9SPHI|nr:DMT family transporter [Mucilaginibacter lappiensis]MBB6107779.1 drug/metabolite transporter (DMT)-like permease [Mucilaginibacter lappiensis]SIP97440.1 Threonine/homoserine efflux transporter RhtA [Mucilaginibacter lappiensis]